MRSDTLNDVSILGVACLLAFSFDVGYAQERGDGWTECEMGQQGTTVVRGRLVTNEEQVDVSRGVSISAVGGESGCSVRATGEGDFEFRGVPPGRYRIGMGSLGVEAIVPIEFTVAAEDVLSFEIPLHRENRFAQCMGHSECAPVLARRTSAESQGQDRDALLVLGYRLGIVLAGENWDRKSEWVACVEDFERIGAALAEAFPNVAPVSECELRETEIQGITRPIRAQRHIPSDRLARVIRVDSIEETTESTAVLHLSYYFAPLWAQGHRCEVELSRGVWRPLDCRMLWIS